MHPLTKKITRKLVAEGRRMNWESRFECFSGIAQGFVEFANNHPEQHGELPDLGDVARELIIGFGAPRVTDKHQALMYFASSSMLHKGMSIEWQVAHQDEVRELMASLPTMQ